MSNFIFLHEHNADLAALGATAEKIFALDPASCVARLRLLAEAITREVASRIGIASQMKTQAELLREVDYRLRLDPKIREMFHFLRVRGNEAAHQLAPAIGYRDAMDALKIAREVALWFHRTFGNAPDYRPGPFKLPDDPSQKLAELQKKIAALEAQQSDHTRLLELKEAELAQERELARLADEERTIYAQLAEEANAVIGRLQADREKAATPPVPAAEELKRLNLRASDAAGQVELDEAATRLIIDQQLREAGWQVDTRQLTHAAGTRPQRGQNMAIAEWPMGGRQKADYVLFCGLQPVAVVEAKRRNTNVEGKLAQAERYARSFQSSSALPLAEGAPWPDGQGGNYALPFVYSSNGRPYVKQHATSSGTWFRDVRHPANLARPLQSFHSPEGLLDMLRRDTAAATRRLADESLAYLGLRDYQQRAIAAVEQALAQGQSRCLLAMATGTGKTRTIIGLIYRLLKAERFRRILFLVDRTALGEQAQDAFEETLLEQNLPLAKLYNIAELGDMRAEAETRVQVATVQAMVRRLFAGDTPPALDSYDCIIVDEAHRGYTLDQEMSDAELEMRDAAQYLSSYRRVLDWFDAVRIGLTATPARHTIEIFGKPVFTYSYREAVADDWLIDHEPPIRYQTLLSQNGIHFAKGSRVETLNPGSGEINSFELEDDLHFDVESFNRRVLNESFNRVICQQLAQELDPAGEEKALIFCANDAHADTVTRLLREAFRELYGEHFNQAAVEKITGHSDKPLQRIRRFKNEALPVIAVTVDLLTTGIDVPAICHLVFMRRVKSRILYEQMIGRATRRCDEIGKTVFRIYDPVDLYASLQEVNTMQPLVKDPSISLGQRMQELADPRAYTLPGSQPGTTHADDLLQQIGQKIMRTLRRARHQAEKATPAGQALAERLATLSEQWGVASEHLHAHLHQLHTSQGAQAAAAFLAGLPQLEQQLAEVDAQLASPYLQPVISGEEDALVVREPNWGQYQRPADYLESFEHFIHAQLNHSAALTVVVNRPRDLTRAQLREVRLLLDNAGYSEAKLKAAWYQESNQDIAAGIIAHIRRAALGEALQPFAQRVDSAMQRIHALHPWSPIQRRWLDRIASQLKHETVLDAQFLNTAFARDGGSKQVNKLLNGQLDTVLHTLQHHLWPSAA